MALASSTMSWRRLSKREAAPEKVNATRSPISANTAASTAPSPAPNRAPYLASWRRRTRRPSSSSPSIPTKTPAANSIPAVAWFMSALAEVGAGQGREDDGRRLTAPARYARPAAGSAGDSFRMAW
jgi:hypothetical protein